MSNMDRKTVPTCCGCVNYRFNKDYPLTGRCIKDDDKIMFNGGTQRCDFFEKYVPLFHIQKDGHGSTHVNSREVMNLWTDNLL